MPESDQEGWQPSSDQLANRVCNETRRSVAVVGPNRLIPVHEVRTIGAALRHVMRLGSRVIIHTRVCGAEEELELKERGREHSDWDEDEEEEDGLEDPATKLTVLVGQPEGAPVHFLWTRSRAHIELSVVLPVD